MNNWIFLVVALLSPLMAFAELKEFTRDYTYIAGEADSKISARQMAMQEVKRDLLSEIGTHIYSRIDMSKNSEGETNAKQEIRAMTAGLVKVDVLEERWNGYEFYIKAKMVADPKEILKRIRNLAENDEEKIKLKEQLNQSAKAFEGLRLEMLELKRTLDHSTSNQEVKQLALKYAEASKSLSIAEVYEKGQDFYWGNRGEIINYAEAKKWYLEAAHQGDTRSQRQIGLMYTVGRGVPQDYIKATYWLQKVGNNGDVDIQFILGSIYELNKDIQDYAKAAYWFQKAADQGDKAAQFALGRVYEFGEGVQDYKRAAYWYQKAAEQGEEHAQFALAGMYEIGSGVQQDGKQAFHWYQKAADQGYSAAQYDLGNMYRLGVGIPQSNKQAFYWYHMAAEQGFASSQMNLGVMYAKGMGVQQSDTQAIFWYEKAADQGHPGEQYGLGAKYELGKGVKRDEKQALYWYQKAADQGHKYAIESLEGLR
jgi:TPR repeat protein